MNKPKEVLAFYNSLEALKSLNVWNINRELSECSNIKSDLWRRRIITERKVLFFNLNDGQLYSNAQSTNKQGKPEKVLQFSKTEISFLVSRMNETASNWLKARYAHVLWQETKNNTYAEIAIDNYIESINMIKSEEATELNKILPAIIHISKNTKKRVEESRKTVLDLLYGVHNWFKFRILKSILKHDFLKTSELNVIADNVTDWLEPENPLAYFTNKQSLETALILFDRIKRGPELLYELLAANQDQVIAEHEDESFVKLTATTEKAKYLKKAKNGQAYQDALKECTRLKQTIKLARVQIPMDNDLHELFNKYLKHKTDEILTWPTNAILSYFTSSEELLVDPDLVKRFARENEISITDFASLYSFDINSNVKYVDDAEKPDREILQAYGLSHTLQVYGLFVRVFIEGMIMGKVNYYILYDFLEKNTWYGMKFRQSLRNEEDDDTTWLTLLAPGIQSYFSQFELSALMNTNKVNNFVLCIDSLSLKFEGALRDFIRLSGGTTMIEKKGKTQEQLLEELLENPVIKQYFTQKDSALFKFVFTNKGKNIRNNVAHCFFEFSDYNLQMASLIFFCLLRLGKYTFEREN